MTHIGTVDRILLLLREQLRRAAEHGPHAAASTRAGPAPEQRPLDRARTLALLDGIDPDQRRKLMVRTLLLQQFGETVGADPAFSGLVSRIADAVRDIPDGDALIDRAIRELGTPG